MTTLSLSGYMVAGAITGAVSGYVATGSLRGAVNGAVSGAVFGGLGYGQHVAGWGETAQYAAHAMAGGVISDLQGGSFGHGFMTAGVMKAFGKVDVRGTLSRTMVQALAGGTVSKITGGKFANGAITSAIQYIANEASVVISHPDAQIRSWFRSMVNEVKGAFNALSVNVSQAFASRPSVNRAAAVSVAGHIGLVGTTFEGGMINSSEGQMCSYVQLCERYGPGIGANAGGVFSLSPGTNVTEGQYKTSGFFLEAGSFSLSHTSDGTFGLSSEKVAIGWLYGAGYQRCHVAIKDCGG